MLTRKDQISVYSNLSLNKEVSSRMLTEARKLPGWFGLPIKLAGGNIFYNKSPYFDLILNVFKKSKKILLLCFNPSIHYFILFLLPLPIKRISLYQWRPLGRLSRAKRIAMYVILIRAHSVFVYSEISKRYLRRYLKLKNVNLLNLYTDTNYFIPDFEKQKEKFVLVPGDHLRDENILKDLSEKLNIPIRRVTRNSVIKNKIEALNLKNVSIHYNIPFSELRGFYQSTSLTLILSDSSEIPTGITTLCEALSCGSEVLISKGHSNVGEIDLSHEKPYHTIDNKKAIYEIVNYISSIINGQYPSKSKQSRDYAELRLSLNSVSKQWKDEFDKLFKK